MVIALTILLYGVPAPVQAHDATTFAMRFQTTTNGDFVTIGNVLTACDTSIPDCATASERPGASVTGLNLELVDLDSHPETRSSSYAELVIPPGATVVWAGLYWGGRTTLNGTVNDPILFKWEEDDLDDSSPYSSFAGSTIEDQYSTNKSYQSFVDVTQYVQDHGSGIYWGANISWVSGPKRYAGWALTVVYQDPSEPLRNITIYDGLEMVNGSSPNPQIRYRQVIISDIHVPITAQVNARTTSVAWEGDGSAPTTNAVIENCLDTDALPQTAAVLQNLQAARSWGVQLQTGLSTEPNYFNSTIDTDGANVANRMPNSINTMGLDIKNHRVSPPIPAGIDPTDTCLVATSTGDLYFLGVFGLAIELPLPDLEDSIKEVVNLSGNDPAEPGDTLRYTITVKNTGDDGVKDVIITDVLPDHTTYVEDSLQVLAYYDSSGNPVTTPRALTDDPDDDEGEYDEATNTITVYAGIGAMPPDGGIIPHQGEVKFSFEVTLDDDSAGLTIINDATVDYLSAPDFEPTSFTIDPVEIEVEHREKTPDGTNLTLTITPVTKVSNTDGHPAFIAGGSFTYWIDVAVLSGLADAEDVELINYLPPGFSATKVTTEMGTCVITGAGSIVSCDLGTLVSGSTAEESDSLRIIVSGTLSPQPTSNGTSSETRFLNQVTLTSSTPGLDSLEGFTTSAQVLVDVIVSMIGHTGGVVAAIRAYSVACLLVGSGATLICGFLLIRGYRRGQ